MDHYLDRQIDYLRPEIADAFDELPYWSAPFGLLLLREMPMLREGRVLDLGCGTGFPLTLLAARLGPGVEITGLDTWDHGRARAARRAESYQLANVKVEAGSADAIPYPDQHFDMVTANLLLNNVPDVGKVFAEATRVLKPGGAFCVTTNLQGTFTEIHQLLMEAMSHLRQPEALHAIGQAAAARRSPAQVRDLFWRAGLGQYRQFEVGHSERWSGGAAFLNDPLIVMGFLPGWKKLIPENLHRKVFDFVERSLDHYGQSQGSVALSIPMLYAEGRKPAR